MYPLKFVLSVTLPLLQVTTASLLFLKIDRHALASESWPLWFPLLECSYPDNHRTHSLEEFMLYSEDNLVRFLLSLYKENCKD